MGYMKIYLDNLKDLHPSKIVIIALYAVLERAQQ